MSKRNPNACPSCGGLDIVDAVDRDGNHYPGCAKCIIRDDHETAPKRVQTTEFVTNSMITDPRLIPAIEFIKEQILDHQKRIARFKAFANELCDASGIERAYADVVADCELSAEERKMIGVI